MWYQRLLVRISNWFWPRHSIKIRLGQSVVIIGRPGTGKSTLLRWLLKYVGSVIIYDSKYDPEEWPTQTDFDIVERASELNNHARVVLRTQAEWLDNKEEWDAPGHPWSVALEHPMQRGSTIAVFDEALRTWPSHGGHPGTHRLVQQGRSFRVTVVVGSQLANNIDTRLLRMANHIIVMGPCRHGSELESLFMANHIDTYPVQKLRKQQIAWWSEDSDHWNIFRRLKRDRHGRLRQRKIRPRDRFILSIPQRLGCLFLPFLYFLIAIIKGPRVAVALILSVLGYSVIRGWQSRRWKIEIESQTWEPGSIEQIPSSNSGKRPAKNFRVMQ